MIAEEFAKLLTVEGLIDYRPPEALIPTGGDTEIDWMPDEPDEAVGIFGVPGPRPDGRLGWDIVGLQVRTRHGWDPAQSSDRNMEIYSALHGRDNFALGDGTWCVGITAVQSYPMPMGRDQKGRPEHSLNYDVEVRALTAHRE